MSGLPTMPSNPDKSSAVKFAQFYNTGVGWSRLTDSRPAGALTSFRDRYAVRSPAITARIRAGARCTASSIAWSNCSAGPPHAQPRARGQGAPPPVPVARSTGPAAPTPGIRASTPRHPAARAARAAAETSPDDAAPAAVRPRATVSRCLVVCSVRGRPSARWTVPHY